jgi:hypothetical protein
MEKTAEISAPVRELEAFLAPTTTLSTDDESPEPEPPPFFLGQISERAGVMYEKIRAAVDNKEEHFLRRHAIRRITRRISRFSGNPERIARTLFIELFHGGYLPRRSVSKEKAEQVTRTLTAFLALDAAVAHAVEPHEYPSLHGRLLDIIAGALEDDLYSTKHEEAAVRLLARISTPENATDPLSYYVAAWRSLFAADRALLVHKLWLLNCPDWRDDNEEKLELTAAQFRDFVRRANLRIDGDSGRRLVPRMRNLSIATAVIYEMLKRYGAGFSSIIENKGEFELRAREMITAKYRDDSRRGKGRAWRAILYILITKTLLALGIETAYISLWKAELNTLAIATNVLFHPMLLFALTSGITQPPKKNTERLIELLDNIIYGEKVPPVFLPKHRSSMVRDIALVSYVALFFAICFGLTDLLHELGFHAIDIVFFLFFLALVLYFGFRIRYSSLRMELAGGRERFLRSAIELAALPVVSVGRWMVTKFESLNIIAIFLDFFIEMPFKLVLRFFDAFSDVVREKKDEIYS